MPNLPIVQSSSAKTRRRALWVAVYVAVVLGVDTLAAQRVQFVIDWRMFLWVSSSGFDWFKFVTWFAIPFAAALPWLDLHALSFKRWKRMDLWLLAGLAGVGAVAVIIIPLLPGVRDIYPGYGVLPAADKQAFAVRHMIWVFSWLIGWEFLHRYTLLRAWDAWLPRVGWLIVPLSEGLYHLQKPLLEALGMVLFSLVLTYWARKRRNVLLPFLAHLIIEIELLIFLMIA